MRTLFLFSLLFLFSVESFAQKSSHLFMSVQSGVGFSKYHLNKKDDNVSYSGDFKNIILYNLAITFNYKFRKSLLFQSGIALEGKGSFANLYGVWFYGQSTTRAYYLTVPLNFLRIIKLKKDFSFFAGSGLSASLGLLGTNKYENWTGDFVLIHTKGTDKIQFGKSGGSGVFSSLSSFDYGINLLSGVSYKRMGLQCQYNFGMKDVSIEPDDKGKNRALCFLITYIIFK